MKLCLSILGVIAVALCGCEKSKPETSAPSTLKPKTSTPTSEAPPLRTTEEEAHPLPGRPQGAQLSSRMGGDPAERARQRLSEMQTSLNLTPEQSEQVKAILDEQVPAMVALRSDSSLSQEGRHEKMRAIRQNTSEELAKVLTPEQKAKWDAAESERRARRELGGNPPPAAAPLASPAGEVK